jgi:hypothetical protein
MNELSRDCDFAAELADRGGIVGKSSPENLEGNYLSGQLVFDTKHLAGTTGPNPFQDFVPAGEHRARLPKCALGGRGI